MDNFNADTMRQMSKEHELKIGVSALQARREHAKEAIEKTEKYTNNLIESIKKVIIKCAGEGKTECAIGLTETWDRYRDFDTANFDIVIHRAFSYFKDKGFLITQIPASLYYKISWYDEGSTILW